MMMPMNNNNSNIYQKFCSKYLTCILFLSNPTALDNQSICRRRSIEALKKINSHLCQKLAQFANILANVIWYLYP